MTNDGNAWVINPDDIRILRNLLKRKREIAADPIMAERRRLWTEHASLCSRRPMILAETSGVLDECVPLSTLHCQEPWARSMERGLRELIFRYESVGDDFVVEPRIRYGWFVETGDFGVQTEHRRGENDGKLGSYKVDPPIKDLARDLDRLHFRSLRVDREKTAAWAALLEEQFGDILPPVNRGWYWWTTGLTITAIDLIGMEQMLVAMVENPAGLHRLMAFLRDDMLHYLEWFEREGLLPLNNEDDYVGSGSIGYTSELPAPDRQPGEPVRVADLWGLSESQETVGVSPRMFEEFVFQYQYPIISRFGLSYYGCCEPIDRRIKIIKRLPNLRRLSVSPWCNQQVMADELGRDYIFCRKPAPSLISTDVWDEDAIRADLRTTVRIAAAAGCPLEFAMKDVHTLAGQPWRLGRWVQIAREVCEEA
jgi:hypothetical protein